MSAQSPQPSPPVRHRAVETATAEPASPAARGVLAVLRLSLGWYFLWAFVDKMFGLGYSTPPEGAWINGGSPTHGFLTGATSGPLAGMYQSFAGAAWADWLFMVGLLGIGAAFLLGIGMRIGAASGALMLVLMWSAVLPPDTNPFMDDHLIMALAMVALAMVHAGHTVGLGRWWDSLPLVRRFPALR
ncbi:DoxX family membrane protein [Lipingzhangella sp. LS1_29]|uniref:DoxX family membrane protein n=1 Tax=Lipingzhangella rawalii TaxID=2055835 RepID=A0ABU2HAK6_9ACTN|nr:DoxX family membrane protein [Lipingzhangella rawalii]MDS1272348.1 DoxX family membrane protein [Lipingzhangella rawalii]MDS1272369.1 DoxX family membrane protein [Lipingzhangella rawalii]